MATDDLRARAEAWLADDPDPAARDEITTLLAKLPDSADELADRFAGTLTFGTAGLRGRLRAGPNGMNLAVVSRAAAGLIDWLAARGAPGPLVIGYDARHGSREFAEQTARIATGAGRTALLLPRPLPTPVLAYAVRALDAVAGVMVTASHNPPQDNGYKVYLGAALGGPSGTGAQIVPPADAEIEAAIQAVRAISEVPLGAPGTVLPDTIISGYVEAAVAILGGGPRELRIAYTPLHGVGGAVAAEAFERAGFGVPAVVAEQAEPDPDFPTLKFPNPEEPGAMDLLVALATSTGADLAVANDPDADRCAVAVPDAGGGWRPLTGDQLGILLADHLIRRGTPGTFATTIVSSTMLQALCAARGVPYGETLTGFKWIVRAAEDLAFGYEEALGYCVAPALVRDKDGITAALLVAELAAGLRAEGRTPADRLDELDAEFGVHRTDQLSIRVDDLAEITRVMTHVRDKPPATLLGDEVTDAEDRLPDADVLTFRTGSARVVIRPSGTEPKLKAYLEVVETVTDSDVATARTRADAAMTDLRAEVAAALGR
jgi:phosphomannomutase